MHIVRGANRDRIRSLAVCTFPWQQVAGRVLRRGPCALTVCHGSFLFLFLSLSVLLPAASQSAKRSVKRASTSTRPGRLLQGPFERPLWQGKLAQILPSLRAEQANVELFCKASYKANVEMLSGDSFVGPPPQT